ncbi:MYB-like transcription factor ETC1 isoform X2 [Andrographis paniculata]|uniref:MYB-like transcription factor ETC1 isoform X2 n=1 Tax=Andrographis paniculata TaxID=175694 RepID=UPI0021E88676|nr:MYB-like transcription factor ETC1 isoform X2 [Andrographis paniculata]
MEMAACSGKHSLDSYSTTAPPAMNRKESEVNFSEDEKELMLRMYNLVGERWSIIAGRIPGRSAEEIKKYWTSRCSGVGK